MPVSASFRGPLGPEKASFSGSWSCLQRPHEAAAEKRRRHDHQHHTEDRDGSRGARRPGGRRRDRAGGDVEAVRHVAGGVPGADGPERGPERAVPPRRLEGRAGRPVARRVPGTDASQRGPEQAVRPRQVERLEPRRTSPRTGSRGEPSGSARLRCSGSSCSPAAWSPAAGTAAKPLASAPRSCPNGQPSPPAFLIGPGAMPFLHAVSRRLLPFRGLDRPLGRSRVLPRGGLGWRSRVRRRTT